MVQGPTCHLLMDFETQIGVRRPTIINKRWSATAGTFLLILTLAKALHINAPITVSTNTKGQVAIQHIGYAKVGHKQALVHLTLDTMVILDQLDDAINALSRLLKAK